MLVLNRILVHACSFAADTLHRLWNLQGVARANRCSTQCARALISLRPGACLLSSRPCSLYRRRAIPAGPAGSPLHWQANALLFARSCAGSRWDTGSLLLSCCRYSMLPARPAGNAWTGAWSTQDARALISLCMSACLLSLSPTACDPCRSCRIPSSLAGRRPVAYQTLCWFSMGYWFTSALLLQVLHAACETCRGNA
jgi:hypothetical protein